MQKRQRRVQSPKWPEEEPAEGPRARVGWLFSPRVARTRKHLLPDVVMRMLCAVMAGAAGWIAVDHDGRAKEDWLRRFLSLPPADASLHVAVVHVFGTMP